MNRLSSRAIICAAAAAAFFALSAPLPAQARMLDPGLSSALPAAVVDVRYRHHNRDRRSWRHHRRHRYCRNERVRVRIRHGHFVFRTHRRCHWRRW